MFGSRTREKVEKRKAEIDILERVAIYEKRLAEFKREMEAIGVKVKVTASFGIWTSTVEEASER